MVIILKKESAIECNRETTGISLLSDLKDFETQQEKRLVKVHEKAEQDISIAQTKLNSQSTKLKLAYSVKLEKSILKEKEKAKKDASQLFDDSKRKEAKLKKDFVKNKAKAVDSVFEGLLGGK